MLVYNNNTTKSLYNIKRASSSHILTSTVKNNISKVKKVNLHNQKFLISIGLKLNKKKLK